jgi:rhomboid protease GluP
MRHTQAPITTLLIVINSLLYGYLAIISMNPVELDPHLLVSYGAIYTPLVVAKEEWWRIGTATFLHANLIHILFNMFALYIIGRSLESLVSKSIYIGFYALAGLLGSMTSLYFHPESIILGASGAIFGLFGLLVAVVLVHKEKFGKSGKQTIKEFGIILALNVGIGLSVESVDLSAHIAGFLVGLLGGAIVAKKPTLFWWVVLGFLAILWVLHRELLLH